MKKIFISTIVAMSMLCSCGGHRQEVAQEPAVDTPVVYYTEDITPESLVRIYQAMGVEAQGRVAVKISSGEGGNKHYLKPELIGQLVNHVKGTLVECNTAYAGTRDKSAAHWQTIKEHGFLDIAKFDLMDENGEMQIPVLDTIHIKYNLVGDHLANYDFMINLAHFKGHQMGGFGGVLKNASIGVASTAGKAYIHSHGVSDVPEVAWQNTLPQDAFLESMAAAAQAVHNYMGGKVIYINVMNNMSVDCDCNGQPESPQLMDMGILASLDPVALDQACVDKVFSYNGKPGDDNAPLIERINSRHGTHTIDHAEAIGLGSKKYTIIEVK